MQRRRSPHGGIFDAAVGSDSDRAEKTFIGFPRTVFFRRQAGFV